MGLPGDLQVLQDLHDFHLADRSCSVLLDPPAGGVAGVQARQEVGRDQAAYVGGYKEG
jgi:hypothetical protein